jgi:radical SAM domain protein
MGILLRSAEGVSAMSDRRVLLIQLYSNMQPANCEPFSISVLGGHLIACWPDLRVTYARAGLGFADPSDIIDSYLNLTDAIIGISAPQGTFHVLSEILQGFEGSGCLIVVGHAFGGLGSSYLLNKFPWVRVVDGWGEEKFAALAAEFFGVSRPAKQWGSPPVRLFPAEHLLRQVEGSRGCAYGSCTFCTRMAWPRNSFHVRSLEFLHEDLESLASITNHWSFADEDFFGSPRGHLNELAALLSDFRASGSFTASVRAEKVIEFLDLLDKFRYAGWRLAFVGVESLSHTQLRRYGKRARISEIQSCVERLRYLDIDLELGFIPFDPWVTLTELNENYSYMIKSGLGRFVGSPFSRMRLQMGAPMFNRKDLAGKIDVTSLSKNYNFMHADVANIYNACREWWNEVDRLYLLLRSVSREFSAEGSSLKNLLEDVRMICCEEMVRLLGGGSDFNAPDIVKNTLLLGATLPVVGESVNKVQISREVSKLSKGV